MNPIPRYIEPEHRTAAWAAMAADRHRTGQSLAQIAAALCVDEPTARRLLAMAKEAE